MGEYYVPGQAERIFNLLPVVLFRSSSMDWMSPTNTGERYMLYSVLQSK